MSRWPSYVTAVRARADLTRGEAEKYFDASSDDSTPVILVELSGHFATLHTGPAPTRPSSKSNNISTGTAIKVIADASTGRVLDFGISNSPPPFADTQTLYSAG